MEQQMNRSNILGWGADLDISKRPAYPMHKTPPNGTGAHWSRPEQQIPTVKVFRSIEKPAMTPVFGTSAPPAGLSGMLRGFAFKYSESNIKHWLVLMLADRINVVEGLFEDLSRGHIPNIFAEMGWKAEWKYNRKNAIKKVALASAIIGVGAWMIMSRRQNRLSQEA